ncbi:MAG: 2-hydroxyglutaryl-CoA dehydratase [Acidobacteria bacterium]|nr:2-hydroxyglutaryl-CoA dehydratase [Acidobacteriota bacterium]
MLVAGVDIGSTATKAAILDENKQVRALSLVDTGANVVRAAERAFQEALRRTGLEAWDVTFTVGTGYGRYRLPFGDLQVTEISCHTKGACFLFPRTRTILDIGGQDTKAIRVNERAEVTDFSMNDKCAAGTGRFLEAAAQVLGLELGELGPVAAASRKPLKITNVCTVFVEQEIVMHLARGCPVEDVLAGVHQAIAGRSLGLLRRVGLEEEITFTGGVACNPGMVRALEERLKLRLNVAPESQYIGAIGAALFAWERAAHGEAGRQKNTSCAEAGTGPGGG